MSVTNEQIYDLLTRVADKLGVVVTPEPEPEPQPEPPTDRILFPTGPIQTRGPKGQNLGSWDTISRWEPRFTNAVREAGDTYGPLLLACFAVVESGGNHYKTGQMTGTRSQVVTGGGNPPSIGIMQVVCGYHGGRLPDADCYTPEGNIRIAAHLLADWIKSEGSWEAALANKYHPGTDPNSGYSPQTYIETVRKLIAEVKAGWPDQPQESPASRNSFPQPTIYDLSRDYARFGLTQAQANKIIRNRFENRNGYGAPRFIVNHIQDGTTPGSLNWWATGPGVQASSTVMANRDGSILRIIPEQHGPWTNGDVCNPTAKSAGLRALNGNPNVWCLTLEAEGKPGISAVSYTEAQLQAILWQYADWMTRYDIPLANVLSHASINFCSRQHCPGEANQLAVLDGLKKAGFA